MTTARLIIAIVILVFALCIVAMNWSSVIGNMRNKRKGVDRHHSIVPIVSFILAAITYIVYPHQDKGLTLIIPLLDIANWRLLWLPVALLRQTRTKEND
jgi:uncharacterized membrane protein